jgi:hypothetical protein
MEACVFVSDDQVTHMPFLSQELEKAFSVYNDLCGQNVKFSSGASAGAKHGKATIQSRELGIVVARM